MARISGFWRAVGPAADPSTARRAVRYLLAGALALALLPAGASAAETGLSLQGAWIRMLLPSRPAAGYFTLHNDSATPRTLIAASSPACGQLMLHESLHQGGQDRMVMVHDLAVPAHGQLRFAPGGYHLMCIHPAATMQRGGSVKVTLHFADGTQMTGDFAIKGALGE